MDYIKGEIILIDDDEYELSFVKLSVKELGYHVSIKYFKSAKEALEYLQKSETEPFLIISDYRMAEMSGPEFKSRIDKSVELKKKIPFVFYSNYVTGEIIEESYKHNIQGFFKKPVGLERLTKLLDILIKYWIINITPNNLNFPSFNDERIDLISD
jgi:response regulator RpfG family c-di-GMP phosphodiesterase